MNDLYIGIILALVIFAVAVYFFSINYFKGLPVLMYHKVTNASFTDYLTISQKQLQHHFSYLQKKSYTAIFLSQLIDHLEKGTPLPLKPILLTFDDGYKNNYTFLYPLLEKYEMKANIFLVVNRIQSEDINLKSEDESFLHINEIRKMDDLVEYGIHTCNHESYDELSLPQIKSDIQNCKKKLKLLSIPYQPALAYTFGAYQKKDLNKRKEMFKIFEDAKILLAFRIGNRLNSLPIKEKFLIQRIDVRGNDSFAKFKLSLIVGRKYLLP